ncbi:bifunctional adenosylcobinamide kinase/adenosylcobinamide-phosphate guanylyltransferase [Ethanoligenens sp.]|uniref:bifunctional adenosylcobinamide kinase/adenosylcobinamide-phosphate guanylyltransferase n=1 Tax=Ethanoligenens sp. TaxID=2099655 RepID=UPI0039ECF2A0
MVLVTGGSYQGKLRFVMDAFGFSMNDVTEGAVCDLQKAFDKPVLNHLNQFVGRMLAAGMALEDTAESGVAQNPGIVVLCDEIGCGIVPVRPEDRLLREKIGRLQCRLAAKAGKVYRVSCGIAQLIKGE